MRAEEREGYDNSDDDVDSDDDPSEQLLIFSSNRDVCENFAYVQMRFDRTKHGREKKKQ